MAENDIIVRLRMAAEEFAAGGRRALEDFEKQAEESNRRLDREAERSGRERGKKIGMAIAAGIGATAMIVKKSMEVGLEIDATSKQLGIGTEALQGWRYAAREAGVQASSLESNVAKLALKIGEAVDGNRKVQSAFTALGVSFEMASGAGRDTEATFLDLLDKLSQIEDPTKRAAMGTALLGEEYYKLEPLTRAGADGLRAATDELRQMGSVLSEEEIRNLHLTNAKFEQMKTVLGIRIAGVVAENADSIIRLADALATAGNEAIKFAQEYSGPASILGGGLVGARLAGPYGAIIGAGGAYVSKVAMQQYMDDKNTDVAFRQKALRAAEAERNKMANSSPYTVLKLRRTDAKGGTAEGTDAEYYRQLDLYSKAVIRKQGLSLDAVLGRSGSGAQRRTDSALAPSVDAKPTRASSVGGRKPGKSEEERERERAIKAAQKAEEDFENSVRETLEAQADSARIEQIRIEQGERAAAAEQARLDIVRRIPEAAYDNVDALAKALGYTEELTDEHKEQLQNSLNAAHAARDAAVAIAEQRVDKRQYEEAARITKRLQEDMQRQQEQAIRDVADLYEDLLTGGTDRIWKNFKSLGIRVISEIAAQWTLSLLSGQPMGNIGSIAGGVIGNSPLGSLFNLGGGLFGRSAANDNSVFSNGYGINLGGAGASAADFARILGGNGILPGDQPMPGGTAMPKAGSLLDQAGFALAASSLVSLTGIGKGGGQFGQLLSMGGAVGGQALGSSMAALGAFGGPVGALAGAVIGSLLGGVIGGVFKKTKRGEATISGGNISVDGNSGSREEAAGSAAGAVKDMLQQVADALGSDVDWSKGAVSISVRKKDWRVDPTGQGISKKSNGALDFNGDQEAAIMAAVRNLIEDGVLPGISQASKNILLAGGDLEKAIDKAVMIESVPRLLRERLDPLGAALDAVDDKFRKLAAALYEAGASTEQIAQAKELWKLERQDVIDQFGEAAQSLKDFLLSLQAGSNSPLSLRAQKVEAEEALKVYTDQLARAQAARANVNQLKARGASAEEIAAAEAAAQAAASKFDQQGFEQTSQLLLSISRSMNASSDQFFEDYDRIRSLTQSAIALIEQATPTAGTASWEALVNRADTTNSLLGAINDNLITMGGKGLPTAQLTGNGKGAGTSEWMNQPRAYSYGY